MKHQILCLVVGMLAIISFSGSATAAYYDVTEFSVIRDSYNNYKWVNDTPCAVTCYMQWDSNRYDYYPGCWERVTFQISSPSATASNTVYDPSCATDVQPYLNTTHNINKYGYTSMGFTRDSTNCRLCSGASNSFSTTLVFHARGVSEYTASGTTACIDETSIYIKDGGGWTFLNIVYSDTYSFKILSGHTYRLVFDGAYHDFVCPGSDVVFDYGECIYVYGYTCGIDTIKLYKDDGGWVLDSTEPQSTSYNEYEIPIVDGEDYLISFIDSGTVCNNQTFSCAGYHELINFDRCNWVYPPSPWALPYIIYLYTGYDYNIVVLKDAHGNFIENSQIAVYDKTDNTHIHKWTDSADGYLLLGAMFGTDHDVQISVRTFDGIFTLDTTYPANGSAAAGDEDITTTNWTIPIMYNLDLEPVDQSDKPLFDVFCTLSEYTPFDPLSFWGMDLSDNGYVPVTNCSGFAMCDIVAEKDGYTDYNVTALNWTTRSALIKDYRHNVVMEAE